MLPKLQPITARISFGYLRETGTTAEIVRKFPKVAGAGCPSEDSIGRSTLNIKRMNGRKFGGKPMGKDGELVWTDRWSFSSQLLVLSFKKPTPTENNFARGYSSHQPKIYPSAMPSLAHVLNAFTSQPSSSAKKREYKFFDVPPLGTGGFAVVKLAHWKKHGLEVAVKVVDKRVVEDKEKYLRILIVGWGQALDQRHEHICPLLDWFETSHHYYLTFPALEGGELLDKILDKRRFNEEESRRAMLVILDTLSYIHRQGVIHRDIKAENFLYKSRDSQIDDFQLIDFGISKILDDKTNNDPKIQTEVSGTPGYAAPEVFLRSGYGKNADVFSAGVVLYAMLSGSTPWDSKDPWDLLKETTQMKHVSFQNRRFDGVSQAAKDFVTLCMEPNPHKRPSAAEALKHHWIQTPVLPSSTPPSRPPSPGPNPGPYAHPPDPDHPIQILKRQETLKILPNGAQSELSRRLTREPVN
ncbi:calcium calmodulin-dependent protein kinase [Phaffia rhodozyma]|uniref:Calcium calmodulin-dependent protein kinase n=1 Tax=Phaffia rhodozyma TaxID=264483 RepID=A0A0F7SLH6_PHARH|nr:calcium calmodulin-dependent protein kinase [Phaffia rhodozyma]